MFYKSLKTKRLLLMNIDKSDREFVYSMFSDDDVNRYLYDAEPLTNLDEADEIIDFYTEPEPRNQHRWIIIRKSDLREMGTCGFHCYNEEEKSVEIGYDLKKEFWNNGYMMEAIKEIIKFAKYKMKIKQIDACIAVENNKSINLLKKFNFIKTGSKTLTFRNKEYLHHVYSLKYKK